MIDLHGAPDRERYKLPQKFSVRHFMFEHGLRDELLAACGGQNNYGLAMGDVLHFHRCGCWGQVARMDRMLNGFVLGRWVEGRPCGRWVISRAKVAGVRVEIATDLAASETTIRRPTRTGPRPPI